MRIPDAAIAPPVAKKGRRARPAVLSGRDTLHRHALHGFAVRFSASADCQDLVAGPIATPTQALKVVHVNVFADGDISRGPADGLAILVHEVAGPHRPYRQFVTKRDRLAHEARHVTQIERGAGGQVNSSQGDGIAGMHQ